MGNCDDSYRNTIPNRTSEVCLLQRAATAKKHFNRVDQNRIYALYMTVY